MFLSCCRLLLRDLSLCSVQQMCLFIAKCVIYITEIHYIEEEGRDRSESFHVNHGQGIRQMTLSRPHKEQPVRHDI